MHRTYVVGQNAENTEFNFYWNKHVTYRRAHVCGHLQPCNGFHPICCACLLATKLDIQDFLETEGNYCRAVIISAASGDTFAESGQYDMQPRVVGVLGPVDCTKETVLVHFDGISVPKSVAIIFLATISVECLNVPCTHFHVLNLKHYFQ